MEKTKRSYLSYEEGKDFMVKSGITSKRQFEKWTERPSNIPASPSRHYKDSGWVGWGDWFGTGLKTSREQMFWKFTTARNYVRKLNLASETVWREYCKSGQRPSTIPQDPRTSYATSGWISWSDWLGNGKVNNRAITFKPYAIAKMEVRALGLRGKTAYVQYVKATPNSGLPSNPNRSYVDNWVSWADWLG